MIIGAIVVWSDGVMSSVDFTCARPAYSNEECMEYIYKYDNPISVRLIWK